MSAPWKKLHLSRTTGSPPLLYKYISTPSSYELYMTDLTNIWSERMSRQAILKRADKDDTTIDPSEDSEQFGLLLQKISDALQHAPGSSTTLHHRSLGSLELNTSIKLPAPLEPLRWTLYLSKEQPSSTTAHLLLPLVEAEVDREFRQKTLIDQLHKKDWILAKLFDKIEAVGIDLSTIFPGISGLRSGRKGTTLAQAAKYIKGVAPFGEQAWLDEASKSSPGVDLASNILMEISGTGGTESAGKLHLPPDAWWEDISTIEDHADRSSPPRQKETPKPQHKVSNDDLEMETDSGGATDDDEFQRQETPPRLKRPQVTRKKSQIPIEKNQETDDEIVKKSPLPERPKPVSKQPKSLGVIGGKKQPRQAPPKSPPALEQDVTTMELSQKHDQDGLSTDEGRTDPGSDEQAASPPPPAISKLKGQTQRPSVKPRGLGVIGGKKKDAQPAPAQSTSPKSPEGEPMRESSIEKSSLPVTRTKRAGKLGVIGGKPSKITSGTSPSRKPSPSRRAEEDTEMSGIAKAKPEPPKSLSPKKETRQTQPEELKKEETEQDRADRRREELKRQLEAKAKAPAKKKRKF
ncbi:XRCC4-like factor-domain-containing protein [Aspergillus floccosus]